MNIKILDSWLRDYLETKATPEQLKDCLSLCGPSVEKAEKSGNDFIYEIEITTNRIDTVGVYGIAREAVAILPRFNIPSKLKSLKTPRRWQAEVGTQAMTPPIVKETDKLPMKITDPQKICNRLMGIVMEVDKMKPSPEYIRIRLEKSGVRSLNNLVDITNYVMLELGHPCHVFDYDRIKTHTFVIRRAKKNEPIVTLDEKRYLLCTEDIIIDDGTGRVIDLPGIMGTENSVVAQNTRRIIFFIESNNPILIRKTSMRYGIRTMAASINEKHPDPELVKTAMLRGIELYGEIAGGKIAGELIDIYPKPSKPVTIKTTIKFINERLGINLQSKEITDILQSLSFEVDTYSHSGDSERSVEDSRISSTIRDSGQARMTELIITPPSFRQFDVTIPEDIVEEVARIYGYHNLPSRLMTGEIPITDKPKDLPLESKIKTALKFWGYTEIYNYSFISKKLIDKSLHDVKDHLRVANPLTEEIEYMRISLIPSMLNTIYNNQHFTDNLNLFELANVYLPQISDLPKEQPMLLISGSKSFAEIKGIVETIFDELGIIDFRIREESAGYFHPKQTIQYIINNKIIAAVGKIHPQLISNFEIIKDVYMGEFNLKFLLDYTNPIKKYHPISLYPPVNEDLTLNISPKTRIGDIINCIYKASTIVNKVEFTGIYKNKATFNIVYLDPSKNLDSTKVANIRNLIIQKLQKELGITS